jgi:hypothetical protein
MERMDTCICVVAMPYYVYASHATADTCSAHKYPAAAT